MQAEQAERKKRPQTYFQLIEKVNSGGKYQVVILLIFCLVWYVTGIILMSTGFLFMNRSFRCLENGLLSTSCSSSICTLPQSQWITYIDKQKDNFDSIATSFGNYYCQNSFYLDLTSSCTYLGAFTGYIMFSFFSDNYGRRKSILLAWGATVLGTVILVLSQNLVMAGVGLFLCGSGSDAAINMTYYFFGQVVQNQKRQKYSIICNLLFVIGAISVTGLFYWIPNWQIVMIASITLPSIIAMALIFFYVEQTPQFLVRSGIKPTLKALNRIGKINYGMRDILDQQDIKNVMEFQVETKQFQQMITPLDLLRFPSLRMITIASSIVSFCIYAMYYGPVLIIQQIGFDIYTSSLIVQGSELVSYLPGYFLIERLPRKKSGFILFLVCVVCSIFGIILQKPQGCEMCVEGIIEIILIFIFRFSIAFYFSIFLLYFMQLYPARTRGMGTGIVSAVGTVASTMSPIVLGVLKRNDISIFILFTLFGIIAIGALSFLPQTKGVPLKQQIEQVLMQKNKRKTITSLKKSQASSLGKALKQQK